LAFFGVRSRALFGKGSSKTPPKYFCKKSIMSKKFPKKSTKISMSISPRLFLFYRGFRCFSAMGVQKALQKTFCKKIVSERLYKKIGPKSKTDFVGFGLSRFWAFLGEGSSKNTIKK
jgi:hypothetical protein